MPSDLRRVTGNAETQDELLRWFRHEVGLDFDQADIDLDVERMCECIELSELAERGMQLIDTGEW